MRLVLGQHHGLAGQFDQPGHDSGGHVGVVRTAAQARPRGSGVGNTLIGVMSGDSRETTMTINDPQTVANERS